MHFSRVLVATRRFVSKLTNDGSAIETSLTKGAGGYTLKLQSEKLARNVAISFGDLDLQVSENILTCFRENRSR